MEPSVGTEQMVQIVLTAVVGMVTALTAWIAMAAKRAAQEANDAVNHRHAKALDREAEVEPGATPPGPLKLYDLAYENHQRVRKLEEKLETLRLNTIEAALVELTASVRSCQQAASCRAFDETVSEDVDETVDEVKLDRAEP